MSSPGRTCPVSYRYGPAALRRAPGLFTDTVWVAGGLYGNTLALAALLEAYAAEPGAKALVLNGDFHWFDADAGEFERVNEAALSFCAMRGNVETEIAAPAEGAGCGCAYPDWVGDDTVAHSNRILERLRATAQRVPRALERLAALPAHLVVQVGESRVGVVHGDAESLAGWSFSQEALATPEGRSAAAAMLAATECEVLACSHTCLPVLQQFSHGAIVNNGAAGMPNFAGEPFGLATRISLRPSEHALYGAKHGRLYVEAIPLRYDARAWEARFLAQWPRGSDAHASYWQRITRGPAYTAARAVRTHGSLTRRPESPPRRASQEARATPASRDSTPPAE